MIIQSTLLSSIPNLRHGFSTRLGGVSSGPFATLNLDRGVSDNEALVTENRTRFRELLGLPKHASLVQVVQVHGTSILDARDATVGASADGLVTQEVDVAVGVRTADCAPVLISTLDASTVGAVHAGWRGATGGILTQAIKHLEAKAVRRTQLRFAIGPTIGLDAFEVGDEVIAQAQQSLDGATPPARRNPLTQKWHLDLRALLVEQLVALGIDRSHIELVGGCTHDEPALYFSYRRDHGRTGRHLSAIARMA